jgi:transcriptional regulator with XRE-family HTH domain
MARMMLELTIGELAERVEISPRQMSRYEHGLSVPPIDVAQRIARALGRSVEELFPPAEEAAS